MSRWLCVLPFLLLPAILPAGDDFPSPAKSVERMTLPEGFRARLVAGEPKLLKPIAAATDERGRLWVVESHSYPHWIKDGRPGKDRVLIFEPKPDGTWSSKVFLDNGTNLSGITIGFGGVWLASVPKIIFLPVKDDKPAGPPVVHLDGFNLHDTKHNVVNSLCWGPDGWLYGLNGIQSKSAVGRPGTPEASRVKMDCGVWRYHPTRKKVEAYAHGTTNPWGLDWDEFGEMFITNCVIKHAFHVVPGAHFVRMYGSDVTPHTYGLIESCADHIHWGGGDWTTSRGNKPEHSVAGGGHAHAGALVYLGDNWPKEFRNRLLMGNLHGSRLNQDELVRSRSGYVIKHRDDVLFANDPWFRPLWLLAAHDGGVYVGDWHDTGECHNYDKTHPSGRVYHVAFGTPRRAAADLGKLSDAELVKLQSHRDEWHVRQARRLLQERAAKGTLSKEAPGLLGEQFAAAGSVPRKLRALWAMNAVGSLTGAQLRGYLDDPEPAVRVWAVRSLVNLGVREADTDRLVRLAREERSEAVLLALASALRGGPPGRPPAELVARADVATDPYLPLMIWYGIEPLVSEPVVVPVIDLDHQFFLRRCEIPLVRRHIARRMAEMEKSDYLQLLMGALLEAKAVEPRRDILRGMGDALAGRRRVKVPLDAWAQLDKQLDKADPEVRERMTRLSVLFDAPGALEAVARVTRDGKADASERGRSLELLLDKRAAGVPDLLRVLLDDPAMRGAALRGLAHYDAPNTPELILSRYPKLTEAERADAVSTLASRPAYARALLAAMEAKKVPLTDVTPFVARQMAALGDKAIRQRLGRVWGDVRPPVKDKAKEMARYLRLAAPEQRKAADPAAGRAVWQKTCASCHTLFGEGGKLGPDLTGSQRKNAEYVLSKVLDPGEAVPRDYQLTRVVTAAGRVLTGYVKEENDKVLTLQSPTEEVRVLKADIEQRDRQPGSLMPDGQLKPMSDAEVRDLLAYLAGERQVSLPAGK
ncbi:MAG: PVC-type heme-binding CxxCH protein [Gemmataceae bacterium]